MLPANTIRTKNGGMEKKPPPPIKPKPTSLTTAPTDTSITSPPPTAASSAFPRTSIAVTDNGEPASTSFGDLRKAFERNQNASPLFPAGVGNLSSSGATGSSPNRASYSRVQQQQRLQSSSTLNVPTLNNGPSGNRPRSVSTPAPPARDTDGNVADSTLAPAAEPPVSKEGIDDIQPDFGNLRARFQSQANISVTIPDTPRPKPPKPVVNPSLKPAISAISPPAPMKPFRTLPPAIRTAAVKSPTPPRTPPRVESPEVERNPFGSDDDEPTSSSTSYSSSSNNAQTQLPARAPSKIHQNPIFQQLNNTLSNGGVRPTLATIQGRDSMMMGKAAPPAPQRAAPRPVSPTHGLPPRLPSRSGSVILTHTEESPEEKERKHRLDKRRRVIQELLETEISYSKDMLLLQEVYVTDMAESNLFSQADEKVIFMNLGEVVELTLDFIALLTPACGGGPDEVYNDSTTFVGEAFLQMEASAQHLLELDSRKELKPFFEACTEKCKGRTTTWDLASMIIKPVQRVLKYPLLINQIHVLTPPEHADSENIAKVQKEMVQIAEEINEIKKRKDIVEKIVGPKKKNDSDLIYHDFFILSASHGFSKKFSRTTQQIRQAVGGSDVTVDILFEALLEKFNMQQHLAREFANFILAWLVSIKQYFDTQESFAMTLREIYIMVPIHRNSEDHAIILVTEFHKKLSQFSKTIGRELEIQLKKTVYKSIEKFLKLFSGPLQVMKKREKKLLDYDSVRRMKEREETIDKNMLESAAAYTAINEQLLDELPKFLGLTTQYFDLIVMEFSKVQMFFYGQVKAKISEYFIEFFDPRASKDITGYVADMDLCEDYIAEMVRDDGPLARLENISLISNVGATHAAAFDEIRMTNQRRRRVNAPTLPPRSHSRSESNSSLPNPAQARTSWDSKTVPQGGTLDGSFDSMGMGSIQSPIQPRYYGEDENPFEIPESVFQDGSVVSDDYEPFGNNYAAGSVFGNRPLSIASSSYSFGSGGGGSDYHDFSHIKPPAMDDGMDADEIGLAQALFECTAIYPYSSTEDRQLSFEAGESIVVFGLNDDGWYFGKKVGKDVVGWFPASHCIQT
ncbi:hypothetical protein BGZ80_011158 [Entomortierella chlamydospora]|uniref:Dynamin-binding protein n=1 Tax=Entomortierella chlamydospora TaxID=101097 RepID=A0A9P6SZU0_9FUNG|nr:hypothetical protein BGZ80_011158 [Entomortierella chlamydospora]